MFSFSASQLRTAVHTWPFCHHLEFETLRIEVHFCSLIAHLSFAPKLIFGHFWSCAEVHFWLFLVILSLYLCIYVRYVSLSVRTYVCMFLRMYVCMYVWSSPNFTPSLSKRFDYRRKAGCFCPSPAQRVDYREHEMKTSHDHRCTNPMNGAARTIPNHAIKGYLQKHCASRFIFVH